MLTIQQQSDIRKLFKEAFIEISAKMSKLDDEQYELNPPTFLDLANPSGDSNVTSNTNLAGKYSALSDAMDKITKMSSVVESRFLMDTTDYSTLRAEVKNAIGFVVARISSI